MPAWNQARQALAQHAACWGKWTPGLYLSRGAEGLLAPDQLLVRAPTKRRNPEDSPRTVVLEAWDRVMEMLA